MAAQWGKASNLPGAQSFGANWQSLLASLNLSMAGLQEAEADHGTASAVPAPKLTPENSTVSTLAAGMSLRLGQGTQTESMEAGTGARVGQGTEKGSVETGAGAKLSLVGARNHTLVAEPAAVAAKPSSARAEVKNPAAEPGTESAHSSRPARSSNSTKTDAVPAEPLTGVVPAAIASLSQAVPVTTIASMIARSTPTQSTVVQALPAQREISADRSADQPAALASASFVPQPPVRNALGKIAEAVNPAVRQTTEKPETPAQQRQATPVPSLSGSSGLTFSETDAAAADKNAPTPVTVLAEGVNLPETLAQARNLTQQTVQTGIWNTNPAETLTTSRPPAQRFAQDDIPIQPLAPSTSLTETPATSPALSPRLAPELNRTLPTAQDHSLIQIAEPIPHPILAQVASQSLTQTTALSTNMTESQTASQAPAQTFIPEQSWAHPLAQDHNPIRIATPRLNPIPAQVASQSATQTAEPNQSRAESQATSQIPLQRFVPEQSWTHPLAQDHHPIQIATSSLNPIPAQVASQSLIQTTELNQSWAETQATSQVPLQTFVPDLSRTETFQNRTQTPALIQNQIPASVACQSATQTVAPSTNPTVTQATNQAPSITPAQSHNPITAQVASQSLIQTTEPNQSRAETQAVSQIPSQRFVPEQSWTHPLAQDHNPIQIATPSLNPIPAEAASQSATQTAAPSPNPTETQATNQVPSQTFISEQRWTHPLAQDHNPMQIATPSLKPIPAQAASQSATQTAAPSTNPTVTLATNQAPSITPAPILHPISAHVTSQNLTQPAAPSTDTAETQATNQVPHQRFVTEQNWTHPLSQDHHPIQIATPSVNPIPAEAASPRTTQSTAPSTNPTLTQATNQTPSQTFVINPFLTPSFVQSQEQVVMQPENRGVNVAGAPVPSEGMNPLPMAAAPSGQHSALPSVLSKPVSAGGGKRSTPETLRPARGAGNFDSVQPEGHQIAGHSSGPAVDASAVARALTGAGVVVNTAGGLTEATSAAATRPDSREAFATLDTAGAPDKTTWIHAGTQRAEAGYQDPALGWVGVRADLSGGGVHAQLVPVSADAAQALGSHLAGLNAYLAEHHTPVETLTLTAPESGWSGLGSGQGTGDGMQQGAGQGTAQGAEASTPSGQYSESVIQSPTASAELPAFFGNMDGSEQAASMGGFHISVMA